MVDELLDIYDKNGKKTGVIKKRGIGYKKENLILQLNYGL